MNTKYSSIEKPLSKSIYHGDGHANIEVDLNFGHGVLKHRCPKSFDENLKRPEFPSGITLGMQPTIQSWFSQRVGERRVAHGDGDR